ncbi:MAG: hypothetical protein HY319_02660 [Armatimonadetes bacterium]|nr:hypothetical protein [Armatimonadota bacterium]
MEVRCHLCRNRFEVEEGRSEVRCPRCEGLVRIKPSTVAQETLRIGCPSCLRAVRSPKAPPLRCRYCGCQIGPEDGERLGEFLEGLDARVLQELLEGAAPAEIVRRIRDQGIVEDKAFAFVDQQVQELPFERWKRRESGEPAARPASTCDSCGVSGKELKLHEAEWGLDPEAMKRYRDDWGGFTGEFGKLATYTKWALYYLCDPCRRLPAEKFAGGYPARNGYVRRRFKPVKS